MAAATTLRLRHSSGSDHKWMVAAVAMLALAIGSGYALAMGEMAGLYVTVSLVCAIAVLLDFRIGALLLILLLPASRSTLFPHSLMGIAGLNPINLLILATIGSYLLSGKLQRAGALVPWPLLWLYAMPIALAGLIGMRQIDAIPSFLYELEVVTFDTPLQYLINYVIKPLLTVAVAVMIGAAAARSEKPERFIIPIAVSVWMIALLQIGFVLVLGVSLAALADPEARNVYEPLGIHANELGRIYMLALALLLFVWAETRRPGLKLFLLITLGVLATALLLTFSRTAFAGTFLVGALLLLWKFNARSLSLALLGAMLIVLFGVDILYSRLTLGVEESANAMSAGRIEGIWTPLIPEVAKSPIWGSGLGSMLWSFPMQSGTMIPTGHAHNAYLEALLDMGIAGLALLLAYFVHVWRGFRTLGANASLSPELRGLFQGATAALMAFFVACLTGGSLRPDTAYLWIAIGLMYGLLARRPAG
jgi:O-antigen ligase